MNKYDERYEIRLAKHSDIENIMSFLDTYWREGHIMARDRELFEYEYVNGDTVNFVLAIDKGTQLIEGIFGFLNCSQTPDSTKKDIWGSMWKVVDTHDNIPFLGVELARRVFALTGCRTQIGNGANPNTTIPLRRMFFGDKVARMQQYYLLNNEIDEYKIAIIQNKDSADYEVTDNGTFLVEFNSIDDVKRNFDIDRVESIPYKDYWYINKRFFNHPYYKYNVYGLQDANRKTGALMMTRTIECNGSKIMRIVDYIGDQQLFASLGKNFASLLKEHEYEYIDFYTLGFNEKHILSAGFKLRTDHDPNVIPNYFEPFVRKNADIWAHYKFDGTLFFKADGDQDRPNQLKKNP
ncbi:hypothetical protein [Brevibacillus panacihumi]|uniref:GNAT family N-acetyltransferase n=1 Tax=Brevibacillus panacihumi TaxID=497735 RepID=A0A3M8C7T8_9BACL|nr:hypothetical protein [Brevibacillus panacihumi]RNB71718.1 hypothetical protein EDM58_22440 [Brevibacillus panacihumi]